MMNDTNFPSHNLPGGGCDPVETSSHATAAECQSACDATPSCDMWTFVPKGLRSSPAPSPWCCLKACGASAGGGRDCPDPEPEQGVVSGAKTPANYTNTCVGATCFDFKVDWASGSAATTLPTGNWSVRKLEAVYYPPDGRTYAYVDIVNFSDFYYPDSYSSEVGVYSSPDGRTQWAYHGIVVPRGPRGAWDGGGIASPGAAVADDGTVIVGYAAESSPSGGINRGIGVAIAPHPLGPFVKSATPVASPKGVCGGQGRCDDVIMQSRPGGEIHLYHSVKGGAPPPGDGIRHRVSTDGGKTWGESTLVLSTKLQPGTSPAETIAGRFMPGALGGKGAMVLVTDGGPGWALHAYMSKTPGDMENFVAAAQPTLSSDEHPAATGLQKGSWANIQIGFVPDAMGRIAGVTYSLYTGVPVFSGHHNRSDMGYTHTVYNVTVLPH